MKKTTSNLRRSENKSINLDEVDLKIIKHISRNCRISFRTLSSVIGISPHAVKARIDKIIAGNLIQRFAISANPLILGHSKVCFLFLKYSKLEEVDDIDIIIKKLNPFGHTLIHAKALGPTLIFLISTNGDILKKMDTISDMLKPAIVESILTNIKPISVNISNSDYKIIDCLLSDPKMDFNIIAEKTSLSSRTIKRRIEKLFKNDILFPIGSVSDVSSNKIVGFTEFILILQIDKIHQNVIIDRIYKELDEYLVTVINSRQEGIVFANFISSNVSTYDLILATVESFVGVSHKDLFIVTKFSYDDEWIRHEIRNKLK
jgi:DNA-binding Lrp family transcriptional regulator